MCSAVSAEDTVSGDPYVSNDIYVSPTGNDSNSGVDAAHAVQTIQAGLIRVNNTGTIHLAQGTYNKSIDASSKDYGIQIDRSVTIIGMGAGKTIIDALGRDYIFDVPSDYSLNLKDLTLKNGYNEMGGAIYTHGDLTVTNCDFINNMADAGGAIYAYNCNVNISGSDFTNNNANYDGGAIVLSDYCISTIKNSNFIGNVANKGGALFINPWNSYEIISNNILNNTGSGIYIERELQGSSVSASNSVPKNALINFNRIYGNTPYGIYYGGIVSSTGEVSASVPRAVVNATLNWWGSNAGPNSAGADKTNLNSSFYAPWIVMGLNPTQVTLNGGQTTHLLANFLYDNLGNYHDPAKGHIPDGTPVTFTTTLGQVGSQIITKYTINGVATALLRAWNAAGVPVWGTAFITATTDGQTLRASATILEVPTANAKTIGMLNTGLPLAGLLLGILALFGGFITPRRK